MRVMLKWASRLFNQGCLAAPQRAVSHWHREPTARKVGVNRREGDGGQGQRTFSWTWAEMKKWKSSLKGILQKMLFFFFKGGWIRANLQVEEKQKQGKRRADGAGPRRERGE